MESFGFSFDGVQENRGFGTTWTPGFYNLIIDGIELINGKKEGVRLVKIKYKITDMPSRNNAVLFENYTVDHPESKQAVDIGRGRIKALLVICGVPSDQVDSAKPSFLIGKKICANIGTEKDSQYGDRNKILEVMDFKPELSSVSSKGTTNTNGVEDNRPAWL